MAAVDGSPARWDWNLLEADWDLEESRGGVPVFIAGVCVERDTGYFGGADGAAWRATLPAECDFLALSDGSYDRLVRVAYPRRCSSVVRLQQQGENLGAWVVAAYPALYDTGPPPGAGAASGRAADG